MISDCTVTVNKFGNVDPANVLCVFMLLVHTCNKYILFYAILFFFSVQLRIIEEDHLARSLATCVFLPHFRFALIDETHNKI